MYRGSCQALYEVSLLLSWKLFKNGPVIMFQIRFGKKHFPTLLLAQNTGLWEKVDTWFFSAEERAEVVTEQKKSQSITCPCIIT